MEKKFKKIPFDLNLAKAITAGKMEGRIVTNWANPVRILCFDKTGSNTPIVALLRHQPTQDECLCQFDTNGVEREDPNIKLKLEVLEDFNIVCCWDMDCEYFNHAKCLHPSAVGSCSCDRTKCPKDVKPEFKEGDVVTLEYGEGGNCAWTTLLKRIDMSHPGIIMTEDYASVQLTGKAKGLLEIGGSSDSDNNIRYATDEERNVLIYALLKDSSNKAMEYLKRFFDIDIPRLTYGDVIHVTSNGSEHIAVFKGYKNDDWATGLCLGVYIELCDDTLLYDVCIQAEGKIQVRLATEEERQSLIDALKKEGSDKSETQLKFLFGIDAKPKFNDKDWVLIRSIKTEKWDLSRFGYYSGIEEYPYSVLNGNLTKYCIPYNEQTKHLLGTTDDWEG